MAAPSEQERLVAGERRQPVELLSNTSWARPRRKIEAPMVMMISVIGEAPRAGRDREAVEEKADQVVSSDRQAAAAAAASRRPQEHRGHAAQHHELALREVHDVRGVVDEGEAQRHERVDRATVRPENRNCRSSLIGGLAAEGQSASARLQSPFLISSMRKARGSRPMWSSGTW